MRVWNVLKNDLARTVCSKAFVFAALGLTAATFLTGMDELSYMQSENDLIYIYGIFQYLDFQLSVAEIHDMAKIDGNILLFCNFQDPTGTVIAALGGIENLVRQIVDEHQGFYATGKFRWRDKSKSFRFHRIGTTDYPFIHSLDHSLV